MMDMDWLKRLIRLVEESGIDSLEIERLTTRVRIRKSPPVAGAAPIAPPVAAASPAPAVPPPSPSGESTEKPAVGSGLIEVTSPMVGTFYRASAPDSPPYVSVGDRVEKGQTLCILEAMKLMNELESEVSGTVREITVENAEPVEFGQVLFRIEPA